MPPCDAQYLIAYFFEIGPSVMSGGGEAPITQGEIAHWQSNTGIRLNSWEARSLRNLSMVYLAESFRAKKPDYPAPWLKASYVVNAPSPQTQTTRNAIKGLIAL